MLCAVSLCAPTKSDLQQRDIIVVNDPDQRTAMSGLIDDKLVKDAPVLLVFCGNNRRQRLLHTWQEHPFRNDHLDAFFNAAVDAGIALSAFVTAAESTGLACCPISAIRNRASEVSDLLDLPDHVFPVAGLALGYPAASETKISQRLPLSVTVHENRYQETGLRETVASYDRSREAAQPYEKQMLPEVFDTTDEYGWSEDKARQYSQPEREGFGAFVRQKGFTLD